MKVLSVSRNVFVSATTVTALDLESAFPLDRQTAEQLPAWRIEEYLAVRLVLRRTLLEVAGAGVAASPLAERAGGQPYLIARPDIGVSLSHTRGWAVAAVHICGPVGVDVQVSRPASDRLLRRCCTLTARSALVSLPAAVRNTEFTWIWSVQEACVKATGGGFSDRPWSIPVEAGQREGSWGHIRWLTLRDRWPIPVSCAFAVAPSTPCRCQ